MQITTIERGQQLLRRAARSAQRRAAERTGLLRAPEVDHGRRNEIFGAARRIGVLHIPKSAGSSVSTALRQALDDHTWSPYDFDPAQFGPLRDEPVPPAAVPRVLPDPAELRTVTAASGHFALSTLLVGFDVADIVMLLREPRSRLLSHYEYWRGLPADQRDEDSSWSLTASARELDFDEWLCSPRIAYQTDNVVLRTLLDGHPSIPDDDFIDPATLSTLVPEALRRSASIGWVDLVERGDDMWQGLAARIDRPLQRTRVNTTEHRADLPTNAAAVVSDRAVEALYRNTRADRDIWLAVASRRGVADPELMRERAWYRRLRSTLEVS